MTKFSYPTVSVIVPVYNVENFLPRCFESIANQTLADMEIILVDDGSPDKAGQLCDDYAAKDSRVRVIHQSNQGVSAARNHGLSVASGEFVSFVDADDWLNPAAYENMVGKANTENSELVITRVIYHDVTTGSRMKGPDRRSWKSVPKDLYRRAFTAAEYPDVLKLDVEVWRRITRRSFLQATEFSFDEKIAYGEDICSHIGQCVRASSISLLPTYNYFYCIGHESQVTMQFGERMLDLFKSFRVCDDDLAEMNSPMSFRLAALWRYLHTINWIIGKVAKHEVARTIWDRACEFFGEYDEDICQSFAKRYPNSREASALINLRSQDFTAQLKLVQQKPFWRFW